MIDDIDRDLAIRTVLAEAGNQGPDGMAAVASVIKNRSAKGKYGGASPAEVVTARNQFEPWNDAGKGKANDPLSYSPTDPKYQQAARIVDGVFSGVLKDPTGGATHFYAPKAQADLGRNTPSWAKGQQGLKIGDHMFYSPDDPNGLDLSQGMGAVSQTPKVSTPPMQLGGAPSSSAGGAGGGNPLLALLQGKGSAASPQHGILNQLLFGPQGWQSHLAKAMPNGILGSAFGGGAGGAPPPSPPPAGGAGGNMSPLAALFGLGGGGGGAPGGSGGGMPMQPVASPDAPQPPPRPADLGAAPPTNISDLIPQNGSVGQPGLDFSKNPMMVGAGGGLTPMGGGAGGAPGGGNFMDVLKSLFSIG